MQSVGEGSDHLQLIKFWPSCAPGKGATAGEFFGSALLQPARSVCLSERFFIFIVIVGGEKLSTKPRSLG